MLRVTRCCSTRVPHTSHQTTARVRWATYTFWYVVDPLLRLHHRYYQRKVRLDRALEQNSLMTNCLLGAIVGVTVYVALLRAVLPATLPPLPTLPSSPDDMTHDYGTTPVAVTTNDNNNNNNNNDTTAAAAAAAAAASPVIVAASRSMRGNMYAIADLLDIDATREMLPLAMKRVKRQLLGKLHSVADMAELRRQLCRVMVDKHTCSMTSISKDKKKANMQHVMVSGKRLQLLCWVLAEVSCAATLLPDYTRAMLNLSRRLLVAWQAVMLAATLQQRVHGELMRYAQQQQHQHHCRRRGDRTRHAWRPLRRLMHEATQLEDDVARHVRGARATVVAAVCQQYLGIAVEDSDDVVLRPWLMHASATCMTRRAHALRRRALHKAAAMSRSMCNDENNNNNDSGSGSHNNHAGAATAADVSSAHAARSPQVLTLSPQQLRALRDGSRRTRHRFRSVPEHSSHDVSDDDDDASSALAQSRTMTRKRTRGSSADATASPPSSLSSLCSSDSDDMMDDYDDDDDNVMPQQQQQQQHNGALPLSLFMHATATSNATVCALRCLSRCVLYARHLRSLDDEGAMCAQHHTHTTTTATTASTASLHTDDAAATTTTHAAARSAANTTTTTRTHDGGGDACAAEQEGYYHIVLATRVVGACAHTQPCFGNTKFIFVPVVAHAKKNNNNNEAATRAATRAAAATSAATATMCRRDDGRRGKGYAAPPTPPSSSSLLLLLPSVQHGRVRRCAHVRRPRQLQHGGSDDEDAFATRNVATTATTTAATATAASSLSLSSSSLVWPRRLRSAALVPLPQRQPPPHSSSASLPSVSSTTTTTPQADEGATPRSCRSSSRSAAGDDEDDEDDVPAFVVMHALHCSVVAVASSTAYNNNNTHARRCITDHYDTAPMATAATTAPSQRMQQQQQHEHEQQHDGEQQQLPDALLSALLPSSSSSSSFVHTMSRFEHTLLMPPSGGQDAAMSPPMQRTAGGAAATTTATTTTSLPSDAAALSSGDVAFARELFARLRFWTVRGQPRDAFVAHNDEADNNNTDNKTKKKKRHTAAADDDDDSDHHNSGDDDADDNNGCGEGGDVAARDDGMSQHTREQHTHASSSSSLTLHTLPLKLLATHVGVVRFCAHTTPPSPHTQRDNSNSNNNNNDASPSSASPLSSMWWGCEAAAAAPNVRGRALLQQSLHASTEVVVCAMYEARAHRGGYHDGIHCRKQRASPQRQRQRDDDNVDDVDDDDDVWCRVQTLSDDDSADAFAFDRHEHLAVAAYVQWCQGDDDDDSSSDSDGGSERSCCCRRRPCRHAHGSEAMARPHRRPLPAREARQLRNERLKNEYRMARSARLHALLVDRVRGKPIAMVVLERCAHVTDSNNNNNNNNNSNSNSNNSNKDSYAATAYTAASPHMAVQSSAYVVRSFSHYVAPLWEHMQRTMLLCVDVDRTLVDNAITPSLCHAWQQGRVRDDDDNNNNGGGGDGDTHTTTRRATTTAKTTTTQSKRVSPMCSSSNNNNSSERSDDDGADATACASPAAHSSQPQPSLLLRELAALMGRRAVTSWLRCAHDRHARNDTNKDDDGAADAVMACSRAQDAHYERRGLVRYRAVVSNNKSKSSSSSSNSNNDTAPSPPLRSEVIYVRPHMRRLLHRMAVQWAIPIVLVTKSTASRAHAIVAQLLDPCRLLVPHGARHVYAAEQLQHMAVMRATRSTGEGGAAATATAATRVADAVVCDIADVAKSARCIVRAYNGVDACDDDRDDDDDDDVEDGDDDDTATATRMTAQARRHAAGDASTRPSRWSCGSRRHRRPCRPCWAGRTCATATTATSPDTAMMTAMSSWLCTPYGVQGTDREGVAFAAAAAAAAAAGVVVVGGGGARSVAILDDAPHVWCAEDWPRTVAVAPYTLCRVDPHRYGDGATSLLASLMLSCWYSTHSLVCPYASAACAVPATTAAATATAAASAEGACATLLPWPHCVCSCPPAHLAALRARHGDGRRHAPLLLRYHDDDDSDADDDDSDSSSTSGSTSNSSNSSTHDTHDTRTSCAPPLLLLPPHTASSCCCPCHAHRRRASVVPRPRVCVRGGCDGDKNVCGKEAAVMQVRLSSGGRRQRSNSSGSGSSSSSSNMTATQDACGVHSSCNTADDTNNTKQRCCRCPRDRLRTRGGSSGRRRRCRCCCCYARCATQMPPTPNLFDVRRTPAPPPTTTSHAADDNSNSKEDDKSHATLCENDRHGSVDALLQTSLVRATEAVVDEDDGDGHGERSSAHGHGHAVARSRWADDDDVEDVQPL